jgi:hypothetical protein
MSDEAETKKKLLGLLASVPEKADEQEKIGRALQESARQAREIAKPLRDVVLWIPNIPREELVHQVSVWSTWHETADKARQQWQTFNALIATTSAVTNTSAKFVFELAPFAEAPIKAATDQLSHVLNSPVLVEKVMAGMRRLGLDNRTGTRRSPMDLVGDAQKALGGGPSAVLLPLRGSILGTLAVLLQRISCQEDHGGKDARKIEFIGRQCGRDGLPAAHFPDLGTSGKHIIDTLSGSKDADFSPEKVNALFYEGVAFLDALLASLDETKLNP